MASQSSPDKHTQSAAATYQLGRKWNESGFRPPLCTYRLNWARRTSWGWWDDWDDTVLQTQDSKFEPWRSEAEHATSRSRRLPTILTFTRGWGRNIYVSFKPPRPGTEPRTLAWKAAVLTTTLGPPLARADTHSYSPANTIHFHSVGLMLAHRLRRWLNINPARCQCLVFAGRVVRGGPPTWIPENSRHWANGGSMLGHRLRRWPNINPTPAQCLVLTWMDAEILIRHALITDHFLFTLTMGVAYIYSIA